MKIKLRFNCLVHLDIMNCILATYENPLASVGTYTCTFYVLNLNYTPQSLKGWNKLCVPLERHFRH